MIYHVNYLDRSSSLDWLMTERLTHDVNMHVEYVYQPADTHSNSNTNEIDVY